MNMGRTYPFYGLHMLYLDDLADSIEFADVVWRNTSRPFRSSENAGAVQAVFHGEERSTRHSFSAGGVTYAAFDVSADGRRVTSWASPEMEPANLRELFLETVMRTVLCRLGLPAVHAASLEKDGKSVLLLGAKGAGKSTLAASLRAQGWRIIADDLVRLRRDGAEWCALPGMQRNKLLPDSLGALGYLPEGSERRWKGTIPAGVAAESVAKFLLKADEPIDPSASFPVAAVVCLADRQQALDHPSVANLPPREAVLRFSEHLIRDPLSPHAPPVLAGAMMGDLASRSLVWQVALPNDLQRLQKSAAWLDNFLEDRVTAASASFETK